MNGLPASSTPENTECLDAPSTHYTSNLVRLPVLTPVLETATSFTPLNDLRVKLRAAK